MPGGWKMDESVSRLRGNATNLLLVAHIKCCHAFDFNLKT